MSIAATLDIRRVRVGLYRKWYYALFDDAGSRVSGYYGSADKALDARRARVLKAIEKTKVRRRPCMCCEHEFPSTGPGHRLCDICRTGQPRRNW